ncbi:unnamed protein product [Schistosoma mattheei]|uniref:Uncharacterized protein n=1 Tax=Schistosoma mattheei TaxID=31246 RepID=A0A183PYZ4_9TREM|nr:unnamed protein product [Schistosoma mattheei]
MKRRIHYHFIVKIVVNVFHVHGFVIYIIERIQVKNHMNVLYVADVLLIVQICAHINVFIKNENNSW